MPYGYAGVLTKMLILLIVGFIASILAFSAVAGLFWLEIPKWIGIESEHSDGSKTKSVVGWAIFLLILFPIGLVAGAFAGGIVASFFFSYL